MFIFLFVSNHIKWKQAHHTSQSDSSRIAIVITALDQVSLETAATYSNEKEHNCILSHQVQQQCFRARRTKKGVENIPRHIASKQIHKQQQWKQYSKHIECQALYSCIEVARTVGTVQISTKTSLETQELSSHHLSATVVVITNTRQKYQLVQRYIALLKKLAFERLIILIERLIILLAC